MIVGSLNKIREDRAARIRDIEYIREMAIEDSIDDRLFDLELRTVKESGNIFAESATAVEQIPTDEEFKQAEINRILNANDTISFDDMIGITDDE